MRRISREDDIPFSSGYWSPRSIPFIEVCSLGYQLPSIQLPVFVNRNCLPSIDKRLDVRDIWFSTKFHIAFDVFSSVNCIIRILSKLDLI